MKLNNMFIRLQMTETSEEVELRTAQADFVSFDVYRHQKKWPGVQEAPVLWVTYLGWRVARRAGLVAPTVTFESFQDDVWSVENVDDAAGKAVLEPVDPTL